MADRPVGVREPDGRGTTGVSILIATIGRRPVTQQREQTKRFR
jgi:hypothetical protein